MSLVYINYIITIKDYEVITKKIKIKQNKAVKIE